MARIVLSTIGSLGDLHPMVAVALELRRRGHTPVLNTLEGYREKLTKLGLDFFPLRPEVPESDRELARRLMDERTGPETVIRELLFPHLREMYEDLTAACVGADMMITGEIVFVAPSLAQLSGIKWISTSLAPLSMFSSHDPNVYPTAQVLEYLRPMPVFFHDLLFGFMKWTIGDWFEPVKKFRRDLGLGEDHDPVFRDKYSPRLHLAMFSRAFGAPQPDWHQPTVQTGFCFYDGSDNVTLPPELSSFLTNGEAPIVFTLGSAAVMDPRDFFDESVKAAKILGRRAVLLYGTDNPPPAGLDENVVGFDAAPYSLVFPHAACVVHQGGVGTTAQVLRAGVPHLIMPYSHDQPDNAARCRRAGVAEIITRDEYTAPAAARMLRKILGEPSYRGNAQPIKAVIESEGGTAAACDAIESALS